MSPASRPHLDSRSAPLVDARPAERTETERAILLTVLYADIFDYALQLDQLRKRLIGHAPSDAEFQNSLIRLEGRFLTIRDSFVTWKDREQLIERRQSRSASSACLWQIAHVYAQILWWIPFLRMVAVSGSLAQDNAETNGDVDFFCITAENRLWLVRAFLFPLVKLSKLAGGILPCYLCPNYLLTVSNLTLPDQNLFTAYEANQAVPLWGTFWYNRFLRANRWRTDLLPNAPTNNKSTGSDSTKASRPILTRTIEWLLGGRPGDLLDRTIYRLFLSYYRIRAWRRGWDWDRIKHAYQRNRYTVPEGGYIRVVFERLKHRIERYELAEISSKRISSLFPDLPDDPPDVQHHNWDELFVQEYGFDQPLSSG